MTISIYTNESVPVQVVQGLRRRHVDAKSARDSHNLGFSDDEQLAYATQHKMAIFTHDDDFLRIAHQWTQMTKTHWGIIYVHQDKLSIGGCIRRLKEIADTFDAEDFYNHIEFL